MCESSSIVFFILHGRLRDVIEAVVESEGRSLHPTPRYYPAFSTKISFMLTPQSLLMA